MAQQPILVTGATGTIGSHLVERLAEQHVPVRAFVRDAGAAQSLEASSVDLVEGDLEDPSTIEQALDGVGKVFLLSSSAPDQVQLQGRVVEAATQADTPHVVKVSVLGARPDAPIHLARWHAETEDHIRESGLPFTFLHPQIFMQNYLALAPLIAQDDAFYAPLGEARVSLVDARDVADVAAAVLTAAHHHRGKTYTVTGPEAIPQTEIAEALSTALGRRIQYESVAPEAFRKRLEGMGVPDWFADDLMATCRIYRAGHGAQVSTVVRDLAGHHGRTFGSFAQDYVDAFRAATTVPA